MKLSIHGIIINYCHLFYIFYSTFSIPLIILAQRFSWSDKQTIFIFSYFRNTLYNFCAFVYPSVLQIFYVLQISRRKVVYLETIEKDIKFFLPIATSGSTRIFAYFTFQNRSHTLIYILLYIPYCHIQYARSGLQQKSDRKSKFFHV